MTLSPLVARVAAPFSVLILSGLAAGALSFALDPVPHIPTPTLADLAHGDAVSVDDDGRITLRVGNEEKRLRLAGTSVRNVEGDAIDLAFFRNLAIGEEFAFEEIEPAEGDEPVGAFLYRMPDGLFLNYELIRQGWARAASRPAHAHRDAFRTVEQRARALHKGCWAPAAPTPSKERSAASSAPAEGDQLIVYVTKSGKKYHLASCQHAKQATKSLTVAEARKSYEPCRQCKPPP